MKLGINYKNKTVKLTKTWRLNNTVLYNQRVIEEIRKNISRNI